MIKQSWAKDEFANLDLGDKRLNSRLITICDRFSESPESPINQACNDWAETKGAYRFFGNGKVVEDKILRAHSSRTVERSKKHKTILALQDTSYLIYTHHRATKGIGKISMKKGKNIDKIFSKGLVLHSCLAITTDGLPLGLLDQSITSRKPQSAARKKRRNVTPIEKKESYRWLKSLRKSTSQLKDSQLVTVCDREADIYEFFHLSDKIQSPVLVRANYNRAINKKSRYAENGVVKLWEFMNTRPNAGMIKINIRKKPKTRHSVQRKERIAKLTVKFGDFLFNPPRNNIKLRKGKLPDLKMNAIYVLEENPPKGEKPLEWMLLTNLPIFNFEQAYEKIKWYCLRWRIEMFFKVLKSGFNVESCRLGYANRLIKYLTVMTIVAWRLFMMTLMARTDPNTSCKGFLTEIEWKVLYLKTHKSKRLPKRYPKIKDVVRWIACLGGFLSRKHDGDPGTIVLWRGWKRLNELTQGWNLAIKYGSYG
jgi:hypothetical protein